MNVEQTVTDYICTELLFNDKSALPGPDEALIGPGGVVDSFGLQNLIGFIEKTFGFEVGDLDIVPENFETLSALTAYIERKKGSGQGS